MRRSLMSWIRRLRPTRKRARDVGEARPFARRDGLEHGSGATRSLEGKFCAKPWEHFEIGAKGQVFVCCPKWLPTSIGDASRASVQDIWNSKKSRDIRASILDGSFSHCVQQECPLIQSGGLPDAAEISDPRLRRIIDERIVDFDELPSTFNLCYDESCNLACPSCRVNRMIFTEGREFDARRRIQDRLIDSLFSTPHDRAFRVNITGSGDPFGSPLFRELLSSIDGADFPNVKFDLQTNGVLFTREMWQLIEKIQPNLGDVLVSFDAATADTYAYTRRGGSWAKLQENVAFLSELRAAGKIDWLRLDFVVQQRNYRELVAFVELARGFGAVDTISANLITDWGTYGKEEFATHAIWKEGHPEFQQFLEVLRDPVFDDPSVHLGNVSAYRARALASATDS